MTDLFDFVFRHGTIISAITGVLFVVIVVYWFAAKHAFTKAIQSAPQYAPAMPGGAGTIGMSMIVVQDAVLQSRGKWYSWAARGGWGIGILALLLLGLSIFTAATPPSTGLPIPRPLRQESENPNLILFLHGWNGDAGTTWNKFPDLIMADSRFSNCDVLCWPYPTFMQRRNLNIAQMANWIRDSLPEAVNHKKYTEVIIIAHSMGGLVSRELVIGNVLAGNNNNLPIEGLIEIGTPHLGANQAALARALNISSVLVSEMAAGSIYLKELASHWNQLGSKPRTKAFSSEQDIVVTTDSATHQCDSFQLYPQWGHTDLVKPDSETDQRYVLPAQIVYGWLSH